MISTSESLRYATALREPLRAWILEGFEPHFGELQDRFAPDPRWQALRDAGTALWLDTGDLDGARALWTREMEALTTNNTLLNKEVQRGIYDDLIPRTAARIRELAPDIPESQLVLEIAFVLNAHHGLRLVETFDARVSVEEHTDLAHDVERAVLYGERFHEICPERFIVKLPLTPAGLLAMRTLRQRGVPVNFTLGFSARHNYVAARVGNPNYVNVFLGRLNAFVAGAGLGSGDGVGEKATAASQEAMEALRAQGKAKTRQIAASMRSGDQVWTLAGTDVMTMPLQVAREYHEAAREPVRARGPRAAAIEPEVDAGAARALGFDRLWDVPPALVEAMDALEPRLDGLQPQELVDALAAHGVADFFPAYSEREVAMLREDGKIPVLEHWRQRLEAGTTSLDALLNVSGLYAFTADQAALDERVRGLL